MLKIALNQELLLNFFFKKNSNGTDPKASHRYFCPAHCERESNSNAHACLPAKACYVVCVNTTDFQITE